MKRILALVFILAFCSAAFGGAFIEARPIPGKTFKKIFPYKTNKTDWQIKYLQQRSSFSFDQPLGSSGNLYNFSHRLEWSNHLTNPPKLSYILIPSYETNLLGLSALGISGAIELKPDKHFDYRIGASMREIQGLTFSGGMSYNW